MRIGIGVGDYDKSQTAEFATVGRINDKDAPLVFRVDHTEDLAEVINWVADSSIYPSVHPGQDEVFDMGEIDEEWLTEEDIEET